MFKKCRLSFQISSGFTIQVPSVIGCFRPTVRSINRQRNVRPGVTTEHTKLNRPISDCSSTNLTFSLFLNSSSKSLILINLSDGDHFSSIRSESSSIPTEVKVVQGSAVFSCLIGTPRTFSMCRNLSWAMQAPYSGWPTNKKSPRIGRNQECVVLFQTSIVLMYYNFQTRNMNS